MVKCSLRTSETDGFETVCKKNHFVHEVNNINWKMNQFFSFDVASLFVHIANGEASNYV